MSITATKLPIARREPATRLGTSSHSRLVLWASAIFALHIGVARLGYGLALPALHAALRGSFGAYGMVNAASLGGYLVGALLTPVFLRRVPRLVLWASIAAAVSLAASALVGDVAWLALTRTGFGLASGLTLVAAIVETLESVALQRRGTASACMWAGVGLGLTASAAWSPWLLTGTTNWRTASAVLGGLVGAAGIGYAWTSGPVRAAVPATLKRVARVARFDLRDLARPRRFLFLMLSYALCGFAYIAYATFVVAALGTQNARGASPSIALLWTVYGSASAVGGIAAATLLDGPRARIVMTSALAAGAIGCFIATIGSGGVLIGGLLVGLGLAATPAAATAYARMRSTSAQAPAAVAAITVAIGIGQLAGPLVAGIVADRVGLDSVVVVAGVGYTLAAVFALLDAFIAPNKVDP